MNMWPFKSAYPVSQPQDIDSREYDYIVIGGGTSGCVLASRLSEDPTVSVLLLERGHLNDTFMNGNQLLSQNKTPSTGCTSIDSLPLTHCKNQTFKVNIGEILGGGSRINGTIYTRGSVADYDRWAALGHPEWSYEKVQPYFVKSERTLNQPESSFRGKEGPWINRKCTTESPLKWHGAFLRAAQSLGFPLVPDLNSPHAPCDGIAVFDLTMDDKLNRSSTNSAFLPAELVTARGKRLTICTGVVVSRLEFSGSKVVKRADRVYFQSSDSKIIQGFSARIRREAIICSGAIGSPQVLMLSGIGPRKHLEEHGIEVVLDLPGVGSHLHDHYAFPLMLEVPLHQSLNYLVLSILKVLLELLRFFLFRTGYLATPALPASLFVRASSLDPQGNLIASSPTDVSKLSTTTTTKVENLIPDIEVFSSASVVIDNLEEHIAKHPIGMTTITSALLQPASRGTVRLSTSNPLSRPQINLGFFSNPADFPVARKAVRLGLQFVSKMKEEGFPIIGPHSLPRSTSDADIDDFMKSVVRSIYHYSSTCRMARVDDPRPGVVDDYLRVHGVSNLRVCDASIFPDVLATHLQAPVVMVAERCADFIRGKWSREGKE